MPVPRVTVGASIIPGTLAAVTVEIDDKVVADP